MNFGDNLKMLRKSKKISQESLAEKVGVSRQSVSKWETGESYPEMNNILQICKIFHCNINDLVHTNMQDIDSLDEKIKMEVVKLEKEKQKRMKGISKAIYIISKIGKSFMIFVGVVSLLSMFIGPMVYNKVEFTKKEISIGSQLKITATDVGSEVFNKSIEVLNSHSKTEVIIYMELIFVCMIIFLFIIWIILDKLEKLFKNIHDEKTPFSLENVNYIKAIAKYLIITIIFPVISGGLFGLLIHQSMDTEISLLQIILVLILFALSYVFEYGYEIQKDSKGVMYDEKK